jgi:hypothetical protein
MAPRLGKKRKTRGSAETARSSIRRLHELGAPELREVMQPSEMKEGEYYDSWDCQACNKPIALARRASDSPPVEYSGSAVFRIHCPHCDAARNYGLHERRIRKFDRKV